MTLADTLTDLATSFAWYHINVADDDAADFALLYEYVYKHGRQAKQNGAFWLAEPCVVESEDGVYDELSYDESRGYRLCDPPRDAHDHSLARRIWSLLAFSPLGCYRPDGPLRIAKLDEVLAVLRLLVDPWLADRLDLAVDDSSQDDAEAYRRVSSVLCDDETMTYGGALSI